MQRRREMKASEFIYVKEAKVEMCPEACCGKPITECKCGPDCKHCDCYEKNKVDESLRPAHAKELRNKELNKGKGAPKSGKTTGPDDYDFLKYKNKKEKETKEGKSPHKKGTAKYKKHMAAMHAEAVTNEEATAGGTNAGMVGSISSVVGAKRTVAKTGKYGAPKAPQATNADGTAKNALNMKANVMGGKTIKR
tara:strand:- start:18 stop:599 length:582 start_codon:yes stop_codon:yes gene_type:complete